MTVESKAKWWRTMVAKHGSVEAVTEFMAKSAKKAKHTGGGGFAYMAKHDPKRLTEVSKKGGQIGKRSR